MTSTPWLEDLRHAAAEAYAELGTPTNKHEAWRYADVAPLAGLPLPVAPRPDDLHLTNVAAPNASHRVFLVDGHYFAEPSLRWPTGVTVMSLATACAQNHPAVRSLFDTVANPAQRSLTALNTAAHQDGVLVDLADGATLDRSLQLVYLSHTHGPAVAHHPRVLVHLGRGARLTMIESVLHSNLHALDNAVSEIVLAPEAHLDHARLVTAGGPTVANINTTVDRHAHYELHTVAVGSTLAREEAMVSLHGRGAHATVGALLMGRGNTVVDYHVEVEHVAPETTSDQQFRSILDDNATGNFAGKVVVEPGAAQTVAHQTSRALLLSERARSHAKPQLEIYTDEVRCTHGATSGQLDDTALFYLRARGIDEEEAQRMLTVAFASEWLDRVGQGDRRSVLTDAALSWLRGAAT